ncbi:hypothetical protein ElyMa_003316900 [Elysia marginata]|uniref:Uncharacterized protein n=1 Tax=Elysia marginata TaxID=1093978 RepID=A0AAV4JCP9_9GAST|nr:hypothetical protein ElyMa_003316900 [Elysia marginata]
MRKKIMCSFYHASSTDALPQHHLCPPGPLYWCFYNRAIARDQLPPSHNGNSSCFLSPHVRKVYDRLSDDSLLQRCMRGMTQNANESYHVTIWQRCPKHIFVRANRIKIATALAVATFNKGSPALRELLSACGCSINEVMVGRAGNATQAESAGQRRSSWKK